MTAATDSPFRYHCGNSPEELMRPVLATLADLADLPAEQWTEQHLTYADTIGTQLAHVNLHLAAGLTPPEMIDDAVPVITVGNALPHPWLQSAATVWWMTAQRTGLAGLLVNPLPWIAPATITVSAPSVNFRSWSTTVDLTADRILPLTCLHVPGVPNDSTAPSALRDTDTAEARFHAWMSHQLAQPTAVPLDPAGAAAPTAGPVTAYTWEAAAVAAALTWRAVTMTHTVATIHGNLHAPAPRIPLSAELTVPWPVADDNAVRFDVYAAMAGRDASAQFGDL